ncbi:MAG TPA: cytochrome c [Hyphomonadaceae bacterium]|nr:cytochrome c [Hyphomonadaceae bacterium]
MSGRLGYRLAYAALVVGLLLACAPSASFTLDEISHGRSVYDRACVRCHGAQGAGIPNGPPPLARQNDVAAVKRIISAGKGDMPAMANLLTGEEIDAVAKFAVAGFPAN